MLTLADVQKSYGPQVLFEEVSLYVKRDDRLGFVGPNGAGKSTLFRILLGQEDTDGGEVAWERGARFGFLPQESAPIGEETILEIATGGVTLDAASEADLGDLNEIDYSLEPKAKKILAGLGFAEDDFERPARTFSGGWVMRAHLAHLLVDEPDLLLLDEPTNHLDLTALIWFQEYLADYRGGLIVISHDRAFLNAICTGILELRQQRLFRWTGNYDDYLEQKAAHEEQQAALHKNQQREIAQLQRFVDRFGAKASLASRAKSKEKQIARLEKGAVGSPTGDDPRMRGFTFPQPERSGHQVIHLEGVRQAYGENVVYAHLDFELERGEKLVLVGPNGAGKSTLLKILAGILPLEAGEREVGLRVRVGYFSQNRAENLDPRNSVLEEALTARADNPGLNEQTARDLLGAFLFSGDAIRKPVSVLSGGEKSRLALVKLLLAPPNLLLMDEPTTHLDIPSIDALIAALRRFEGTLVFISHDVHFIRALSEKVVHVEAGRLTPYAGDYRYYLEKSRASDARVALTASHKTPAENSAKGKSKASSSGANYKSKGQKRIEAKARQRKAQLRKEVSDLEKRIAELEAKQAELAGELSNPASYGNPETARRLNQAIAEVNQTLEATTAEWEAKAVEVEV